MTPRTGLRWTIVALCVLATSVLGAVWGRTRGGLEVSGVVVITLDTTRADRLSPYGFDNVSLPALDRLAREGVVFDRASSVAPLTLPAHASLFTGLLPPHHGIRDNGDPALADGNTTLAEILRARGFRTGAFVGSNVLNADRGLAQGFDRYSDVPRMERRAAGGGQRRGDLVVDEAIGWLEGVGASPFFLWTHLYDPHRPYDPPEPFRSQYGHDPYVGEIAFADSQIGRLLDALERRNLLGRTMVVVTADHGESLGAHGERDHGIFVYEDVIRVPLIIRAPGLEPHRVGSVVRQTDIMPTILDAVGLAVPQMNGVSLFAALRTQRDAPDREAYAEALYPQRFGWSPLHTLRSGRFKFIDAPRPELYDLEIDPFEEKNIFSQRRDVAQAMATRLKAAEYREAGKSAQKSGLSDDLKMRLASLGYVASAGRDSSAPSSLPDPKDCIGFMSPGSATSAPSPLGCGPVARSR